MLGDFLIWISFLSGLFMTGVIWFVQIVHYPLFSSIDESDFLSFHREHTKKTTWIVGPPMMFELFSSVLALYFSVDLPLLIRIISFSIVVLIFVSTAFIQVPIHDKLGSGKKSDLINKLVLTNWIRTFLWTLKSLILAFYLIP
jgi:hypothetical protein